MEPSTEQYQWLKADLEAHPSALKCAFWHYSPHADFSRQPSDTYLQGRPALCQRVSGCSSWICTPSAPAAPTAVLLRPG
jgi:hypothetical protein